MKETDPMNLILNICNNGKRERRKEATFFLFLFSFYPFLLSIKNSILLHAHQTGEMFVASLSLAPTPLLRELLRSVCVLALRFHCIC